MKDRTLSTKAVDRETLANMLVTIRNRLLDRGEYDQGGADVVDATTILEAINALREQPPEPRAKPRDLQSLCDRLAEMFNTDDTPDELSTEAREAIEELWESRDAWMKWAQHLQTCTDCHVGDTCTEGKPLEAAAQPETKEADHG